ncbi:MAG TPA: DUF5655 domain-containing protein [Blastocatellia bacterium]|nr:DUF5655 domain-containing protein [Blastocatellia bacterium]
MDANDNLWQCGNCGRPFANRNQMHSCGRYTVEAFLSRKPRRAVDLYNRFFDLMKSCGPVLVAPAKTRVGFQVRMIFAAVNKLSERGLDAHVVLARRLGHPRFTRIQEMSPRCFVHHFRIEAVEELDEEVAEWLREAYRVGTQEQLLARVGRSPKSNLA